MLLVAALVARENIFKINTASNFNSLKVQEMLFFEWMKRWWVGVGASSNAGFFFRSGGQTVGGNKGSFIPIKKVVSKE